MQLQLMFVRLRCARWSELLGRWAFRIRTTERHHRVGPNHVGWHRDEWQTGAREPEGAALRSQHLPRRRCSLTRRSTVCIAARVSKNKRGLACGFVTRGDGSDSRLARSLPPTDACRIRRRQSPPVADLKTTTTTCRWLQTHVTWHSDRCSVSRFHAYIEPTSSSPPGGRAWPQRRGPP